MSVSDARIHVLTLPGKAWKWRMEGGAVELARQAKKFKGFHFDVILGSSMLDLPTFLCLSSASISWDKTVMMMHENQFSYPWSTNDKDKKHGRDFHYPFVQLKSCLQADLVVFNSAYNRDSFLSGCRDFLKKMPDFNLMDGVDEITQKSHVIPLGFKFEQYKPLQNKITEKIRILWNHRWDEDKNPEGFFNALENLSDLPFELVVTGESCRGTQKIFDRAQRRWKENIAHWGYCENHSDYLKLMGSCHLLPVSSLQDFFGISVVEAIMCGVQVITPKRLAYPEVLAKADSPIWYEEDHELGVKLREATIGILEHGYRPVDENLVHYSWDNIWKVWSELVFTKK